MRDSRAPQIKIAFVLRGWSWCSDQTALFKETATFCSPFSEPVLILNNLYTCQSLLQTRTLADHWLKAKAKQQQKAIRSAKRRIRSQPTNQGKKRQLSSPSREENSNYLRQTVAKYCLCRRDIFIKHLPSRADALQNSQLAREHGPEQLRREIPSSTQDSAEQSSPCSHWWSTCPHPTNRGIKKIKYCLHNLKRQKDIRYAFPSMQTPAFSFFFFWTKWAFPTNFHCVQKRITFCPTSTSRIFFALRIGKLMTQIYLQ